MTHFGILQCGHWIADPDQVLRTGGVAPCPIHLNDRVVIATPYDPNVQLIKDPSDAR